jgi:colicin import membrane protein
VGRAPAGSEKSPEPAKSGAGGGGNAATGAQQPDSDTPQPDPRRPGGGRRLPPKARKEDAAEEAKRQAEAEARQKAEAEARQKAEAEERQQDAARQLKPARDLVEESKVERLKGNDARAEKLLERAGQRLREIIDKYPGTRAAAEARDLLDKLGR